MPPAPQKVSYVTTLSDQLWFILESGPYFRQACLEGARAEFLKAMYSLWFIMWPVLPLDVDDRWVACRMAMTRDRIESDLNFSSELEDIQSADASWKEYLVDKLALHQASIVAEAPPKDTEPDHNQPGGTAKATVNAQGSVEGVSRQSKKDDATKKGDKPKRSDEKTEMRARLQAFQKKVSEVAPYRRYIFMDKKDSTVDNDNDTEPLVPKKTPKTLPEFIDLEDSSDEGPKPDVAKNAKNSKNDIIILDDSSDDDTKRPVTKKAIRTVVKKDRKTVTEYIIVDDSPDAGNKPPVAKKRKLSLVANGVRSTS